MLKWFFVFSIDREIADAARQTDALFTCFELLGVLYVEQLFTSIKGTTLANPFRLAIRQMKKHFPEGMKKNYERLRKIFFAKTEMPSDYSGRKHIVEILHNAALSSRSVEIDYNSYSSRRRTKRVVHPYNMTTYEGSIYIIGFDTLSKGKRTFKLDRIKDAKILNPTTKKFRACATRPGSTTRCARSLTRACEVTMPGAKNNTPS